MRRGPLGEDHGIRRALKLGSIKFAGFKGLLCRVADPHDMDGVVENDEKHAVIANE
jgi:hypothetical protein